MILRLLTEFNQLSLFDRFKVIERCMQFPALTVMVWFRRDIGYRLLNPLHFTAMALILAFIAASCLPANHPELLFWFGVGSLLICVSHPWGRAGARHLRQRRIFQEGG